MSEESTPPAELEPALGPAASEVDEDLASNRMHYAREVLGIRDQLSRIQTDLISIEDRKAGLKITLPRLKILEILESNEQRHLSAEDIYRPGFLPKDPVLP